MRYLIASVTMGFLYAYLSYRGFWRRAGFVALATVFPIIANGLRAYLIVMIAILSGMRLALGVDHIIYGWVFFGIVMLLLFWIGSFWADKNPGDDFAVDLEHAGRPAPAPRRFAIYGLSALALLIVWPGAAAYVGRSQPSVGEVQLAAPAGTDGWRRTDRKWAHWKPHYVGPDREVRQTYERNGRKVGIVLAYYQRQRQGRELVNSDNVLVVEKDPVWRQVQNKPVKVTVHGKPVELVQSRLESDSQKLLVWHWYWLNGEHTTSPYVAKLIEARHRLLGRPEDGAAVMVYTPYDDDLRHPKATLREFLQTMLPGIRSQLGEAVRVRTESGNG